MMNVEQELASQPSIWLEVEKYEKTISSLLPKPGSRVAIVGAGTSWFMAQIIATIREVEGFGETDAFPSSEMMYGRKYDQVIAISRSGTTSEVADLLAKIKEPTLVITGVADSPVTKVADQSIVMEFADEKSIVQTRWATSVLTLFRSYFGHDIAKISRDGEVALASDLGKLPDSEQITFLGHGWTVGLANEAALKVRETAQFWSEAYPALDYRHGPIAVAQPGRAVWYFGELSDDLKADILATGAMLEFSTLDPMAHLIRAQRTAIALAKNRGLNPDQPRGLSRSVILT